MPRVRSNAVRNEGRKQAVEIEKEEERADSVRGCPKTVKDAILLTGYRKQPAPPGST